jgi:hypothetical protein
VILEERILEAVRQGKPAMGVVTSRSEYLVTADAIGGFRAVKVSKNLGSVEPGEGIIGDRCSFEEFPKGRCHLCLYAGDKAALTTSRVVRLIGPHDVSVSTRRERWLGDGEGFAAPESQVGWAARD